MTKSYCKLILLHHKPINVMKIIMHNIHNKEAVVFGKQRSCMHADLTSIIICERHAHNDSRKTTTFLNTSKLH